MESAATAKGAFLGLRAELAKGAATIELPREAAEEVAATITHMENWLRQLSRDLGAFVPRAEKLIGAANDLLPEGPQMIGAANDLLPGGPQLIDEGDDERPPATVVRPLPSGRATGGA